MERKGLNDYSSSEVNNWKGHDVTMALLEHLRARRAISVTGLIGCAQQDDEPGRVAVYGGQIDAFDHVISLLEV